MHVCINHTKRVCQQRLKNRVDFTTKIFTPQWLLSLNTYSKYTDSTVKLSVQLTANHFFRPTLFALALDFKVFFSFDRPLIYYWLPPLPLRTCSLPPTHFEGSEAPKGYIHAFICVESTLLTTS